MSHNIDQDSMDRLTIADRTEATPVTIRKGANYLVINKLGKSPMKGTLVEREDLYALRAFLNELPESAFVEPAPSVKASRWTEGDVIAQTGNGGPEDLAIWVRDDSQWVKVTGDSMWLKTLDDEEADRIADSQTGRVFLQASGVDL